MPRRKKTISAIAREHGLRPSVVFDRIRRGMTPQKAVTLAIGFANTGASKLAREAGINPCTLRSRILKGMTPQEAITTPIRQDIHKGLTALARNAGVNPTTVRARLLSGMTMREALITPVKRRKGYAALARKSGMDKTTVRHRVVLQGMTPQEAITTPLKQTDKGYSALAREIGVPASTVCSRSRSGACPTFIRLPTRREKGQCTASRWFNAAIKNGFPLDPKKSHRDQMWEFYRMITRKFHPAVYAKYVLGECR